VIQHRQPIFTIPFLHVCRCTTIFRQLANMPSRNHSGDEAHSPSTSPLSSSVSGQGILGSAAIAEDEATPTQSNPGFGMEAPRREEDNSSPPHSQPPHPTAKEASRHDSITNILDGHTFYTVEGQGRIRASFSFGGQSSEESVRQKSIVTPEASSAGPPSRSSVQPTAQTPDDSQTSHPVTSTSSWTPLLVWLHQSVLNLSNTVYPLRARRAWEWCDYDSTPQKVRQTCQNILTKHWTRTIWPLQFASPAVTACKELAEVIREVDGLDTRDLEVFEFAAGSGGPTPVFEQQINEIRQKESKSPLEFRISDLYPNPTAWKEYTAQTEHLTVIEEPIDATKPPAFARRYGLFPCP
jgi:hypothetical protein